jgi:diguanylate cyclase (GGDEF)-like protein
MIVVAITLLATANCVILTAMSHSPDRWAMLLLFSFAYLYITAIQRVRFLPTLVACAGICICEIILTLHIPQYSGKAFLACALITLSCSVFASYGNYMSERQTRNAYLLSLIARIQNAEFDRDRAYDVLTGLGNRRLLQQAAERIENRIAHLPHAVMMLDIDHFKDLNDHAGHLAGDQCLVRVASLIQSQLRRHNDHAFRYGGEEFVILLENVAQETAIKVAERIRKAIEAAGIPHPGRTSAGYVTTSIGVATGTDAIETLLADADAALYTAKRSGRNRVRGKTESANAESVSWTGTSANAESVGWTGTSASTEETASLS